MVLCNLLNYIGVSESVYQKTATLQKQRIAADLELVQVSYKLSLSSILVRIHYKHSIIALNFKRIHLEASLTKALRGLILPDLLHNQPASLSALFPYYSCVRV